MSSNLAFQDGHWRQKNPNFYT